MLVHKANPVAATKSNNTNKYNTAQALSLLMTSTPFVMHVGGLSFSPTYCMEILHDSWLILKKAKYGCILQMKRISKHNR